MVAQLRGAAFRVFGNTGRSGSLEPILCPVKKGTDGLSSSHIATRALEDIMANLGITNPNDYLDQLGELREALTARLTPGQ